MNFEVLENCHKKWRELLVIGKSLERDGRRYHIMGMTLSEEGEAELYLIEPYAEPETARRKGVRNQRRILKEDGETEYSCLHCNSVCLGSERLQAQGSTGRPLTFDSENYEVIQLFLDMMSAGWTVPEYMKDVDWDGLRLVTLDIADRETLPEYTPEMSITVTHRPDPARHILEKTVTLKVGKARAVCFADHHGDQVQCHINQVVLVDVWKYMEERLNDPRLAENFSPEQLEEMKKHSFEALEQSCPRGMYYIGIEYECSKDLSLTFYSKQYLKSRPKVHQGSASFLLMRLKPDREIGTHGLPLKGCMIETPVPSDVSEIPAEIFLYHEKQDGWTDYFRPGADIP